MWFKLCSAFLVMIAVFPAPAAGDVGGDLLEMEQWLQNGSAGQWPPLLGVEDDDEEWGLPSETARRFLGQSGEHVTYGAVKPNQPAGGSGKTGAPYTRGCITPYNCKPGH